MIRGIRAIGTRLDGIEQSWEDAIALVGESRDRAAFSSLFDHFAPQLKAFLVSGGASPDQAEDLVQETMIKVWNKAPTYVASKAAANTWIYTIARNTRIDWLRKQKRQDPEKLNAEDIYNENEAETPMSSLVQVRNRKQIEEQLKLLPADQLDVLRQMYFEGKSGQQVADELGIPLGTVKSRIRLALKKLNLSLVNLGAELNEPAGDKE